MSRIVAIVKAPILRTLGRAALPFQNDRSIFSSLFPHLPSNTKGGSLPWGDRLIGGQGGLCVGVWRFKSGSRKGSVLTGNDIQHSGRHEVKCGDISGQIPGQIPDFRFQPGPAASVRD